MHGRGIHMKRPAAPPRPLHRSTSAPTGAPPIAAPIGGGGEPATTGGSYGDQDLNVPPVIRELQELLRCDDIHTAQAALSVVSRTKRVCDCVKTSWEQLEEKYKKELDSNFFTVRSLVSGGSSLHPLVRTHLLDLLEARCRGWMQDYPTEDYFNSKCKGMGARKNEYPSVPAPPRSHPTVHEAAPDMPRSAPPCFLPAKKTFRFNASNDLIYKNAEKLQKKWLEDNNETENGESYNHHHHQAVSNQRADGGRMNKESLRKSPVLGESQSMASLIKGGPKFIIPVASQSDTMPPPQSIPPKGPPKFISPNLEEPVVEDRSRALIADRSQELMKSQDQLQSEEYSSVPEQLDGRKVGDNLVKVQESGGGIRSAPVTPSKKGFSARKMKKTCADKPRPLRKCLSMEDDLKPNIKLEKMEEVHEVVKRSVSLDAEVKPDIRTLIIKTEKAEDTHEEVTSRLAMDTVVEPDIKPIIIQPEKADEVSRLAIDTNVTPVIKTEKSDEASEIFTRSVSCFTPLESESEAKYTEINNNDLLKWEPLAVQDSKEFFVKNESRSPETESRSHSAKSRSPEMGSRVIDNGSRSRDTKSRSPDTESRSPDTESRSASEEIDLRTFKRVTVKLDTDRWKPTTDVKQSEEQKWTINNNDVSNDLTSKEKRMRIKKLVQNRTSQSDGHTVFRVTQEEFTKAFGPKQKTLWFMEAMTGTNIFPMPKGKDTVNLLITGLEQEKVAQDVQKQLEKFYDSDNQAPQCCSELLSSPLRDPVTPSSPGSSYLPDEGCVVPGIGYTDAKPARCHGGTYTQEISIDETIYCKVLGNPQLKDKLQQLTDTQVLISQDDPSNVINMKVTGPSLEHVLLSVGLTEVMVHCKKTPAQCWKWVQKNEALMMKRAQERAQQAQTNPQQTRHCNNKPLAEENGKASPAKRPIPMVKPRITPLKSKLKRDNCLNTKKFQEAQMVPEMLTSLLPQQSAYQLEDLAPSQRNDAANSPPPACRSQGVLSSTPRHVSTTRHRTPDRLCSDSSMASSSPYASADEEDEAEAVKSIRNRHLNSPQVKDVELSFQNLSLSPSKEPLKRPKDSPVRAFALNLSEQFARFDTQNIAMTSTPELDDKMIVKSPRFDLQKLLSGSGDSRCNSASEMSTDPLNAAGLESGLEVAKSTWRDFVPDDMLSEIQHGSAKKEVEPVKSFKDVTRCLYKNSEVNATSTPYCEKERKGSTGSNASSINLEELVRKELERSWMTTVSELSSRSAEDFDISKEFSAAWDRAQANLFGDKEEDDEDEEEDSGETEEDEEEEPEKKEAKTVTGWWRGQYGFRQPINIVREPLGALHSAKEREFAERGAASWAAMTAYDRRRRFEATQGSKETRRVWIPQKQKSKDIVTYQRSFLLLCSVSKYSQQLPPGWNRMMELMPELQAKHDCFFNPELYEAHFESCTAKTRAARPQWSGH